jgi:hypothetical protein
LHEYCINEKKNKRKAFVYYIHNKGSCCTRKSEPSRNIVSWRESMNAFSIEFPSICLRALMDGYSTCGMDQQDRTYSGIIIVFINSILLTI